MRDTEGQLEAGLIGLLAFVPGWPTADGGCGLGWFAVPLPTHPLSAPLRVSAGAQPSCARVSWSARVRGGGVALRSCRALCHWGKASFPDVSVPAARLCCAYADTNPFLLLAQAHLLYHSPGAPRARTAQLPTQAAAAAAARYPISPSRPFCLPLAAPCRAVRVRCQSAGLVPEDRTGPGE